MHGRRFILGFAIGAALMPAGHRVLAQDAPVRRQWRPGDAPPDVAGIHLGDRAEQVLAVLGKPDADSAAADPAAELRTLRFRGGALMVLVGRTDGVLRILLNRAEGGDIAGIRVGDRLGPLLSQWGDPPSGNSTTGRYQMGAWTLTVRADLGDQKVLKLMLASATSLQALAPLPDPAEPLPAWATAVPDAP